VSISSPFADTLTPAAENFEHFFAFPHKLMKKITIIKMEKRLDSIEWSKQFN
jgi:hypothetical protein